MSLTYYYQHYLLFDISNIWWKIDSPLTLLKSTLNLYLRYHWEFILKKVKIRLWTPGYCLFCETKWRKFNAFGKRLFHFILSFTTAVTNKRYHDSENLNRSIVCAGLFISLYGTYQTLVCLLSFFSWSDVLDLAA